LKRQDEGELDAHRAKKAGDCLWACPPESSPWGRGGRAAPGEGTLNAPCHFMRWRWLPGNRRIRFAEQTRVRYEFTFRGA
jgi:hypothetical protein